MVHWRNRPAPSSIASSPIGARNAGNGAPRTRRFQVRDLPGFPRFTRIVHPLLASVSLRRQRPGQATGKTRRTLRLLPYLREALPPVIGETGSDDSRRPGRSAPARFRVLSVRSGLSEGNGSPEADARVVGPFTCKCRRRTRLRPEAGSRANGQVASDSRRVAERCTRRRR